MAAGHDSFVASGISTLTTEEEHGWNMTFALSEADAMTATEVDDAVEEEIEMEAWRLMGGSDMTTVSDANVKAVAAKIRAILEDKLAERGVSGRFTQEIIERKLQAILDKIRSGKGTAKTAVQEARLWYSALENAKKVRKQQEFDAPPPSAAGEEICDDETEEVQQYVQAAEIEKRMPLGDAMIGITYRDQYYEEVAYEHNTRVGMALGNKIDELNKRRGQVNDLVDEHNFLMDQLPLEKIALERKKTEYEIKAKEWEEMQKSYARWPEEKEELLFQLDNLHDELLEVEAENAKLNTLVESLQMSVGKHQDAIQVLKSLPVETQEYYKKILAFSNEIAEANDKIDEMQSAYWDFVGMVEKLAEALLKMEMIPATALFMAENFNKSFISGPWRAHGLKTGRIPSVQNKIANSVRMAKRLSVILERARKSEKRVVKGLAF
ncbi:unnamed protein product [Notodromas monacha]|uniref:Uncharacterized protein n=1 Tax=Notodromas monacha TaxID=399045 RepID=A0A7R9BUK1_9CRUS|nr:unnamed protein product [Notodromas monacha]CAG0920468.1 unnamed protein product [Notodromas monacha]